MLKIWRSSVPQRENSRCKDPVGRNELGRKASEEVEKQCEGGEGSRLRLEKGVLRQMEGRCRPCRVTGGL